MCKNYISNWANIGYVEVKYHTQHPSSAVGCKLNIQYTMQQAINLCTIFHKSNMIEWNENSLKKMIIPQTVRYYYNV